MIAALKTLIAQSLLASSSQIQNGTVANVDLATDVKVGSLAALTTDTKDNVVAAINEVDGHADAKYTKPGSGIPSTDLATAVQTSLGKADTALQATTGYTGSVVITAVGTLTIANGVITGFTPAE
jgi:hypothetical protein